MTEQVITRDLRERLKLIMEKEVNELPDLLKELNTKDRLNFICKLMPFVFPKVENVSPASGEPMTLGAYY